MTKNLVVLFAILIAILACVWIYESRYTECKIFQTYFYDLGISQTKISFTTDLPVESFQLGDITYETGCVTGTSEENASWTESDYKVIAREIKFCPGEEIEIIVTLESRYLDFTECEIPPKTYIPIAVNYGNKTKNLILRANNNQIKTKRLVSNN